MESFDLNIETLNEAFGGESLSLEIVRILRKIADDLEARGDTSGGKIRDYNGNTVGEFYFTPKR